MLGFFLHRKIVECCPKMSSDELKRQMLTQKLVRYVRAKHKLAKSTETDLKSESSKSSKKLNAERERGKECDSDLTK